MLVGCSLHSGNYLLAEPLVWGLASVGSLCIHGSDSQVPKLQKVDAPYIFVKG
jgi:hypothetical protein